ncbi:hypothetical protein NC652_037937 [Populus alba x Populus x berolinensis]|nr:hypothetical protein NC652_037937 [Populus alba x Populus x berolinensis]
MESEHPSYKLVHRTPLPTQLPYMEVSYFGRHGHMNQVFYTNTSW